MSEVTRAKTLAKLLLPDVADENLAVVRRPVAHDSARLHVRGAATYIDDIRDPAGTLHIAPGLSPIARGKIVSLDLDEVLALADRVLVLHEGRVTGEFERADFDERVIGRRMLGVLDA